MRRTDAEFTGGGIARFLEVLVKTLVAIDRSQSSCHAVENVCRRQWPPGSEIELLAVVGSDVRFIPDLTFMLAAAREHDRQLQSNAAPYLLSAAAHQIERACPEVRVTCRIVEGSPSKAIVAEAREWGADAIIIGSHGRGVLRRLLHGSVSRAVERNAPCPVQVVRPPIAGL